MTTIHGTIAISKLAMNKAMAHVKELTPRGTHLTLEKTFAEINMMCLKILMLSLAEEPLSLKS